MLKTGGKKQLVTWEKDGWGYTSASRYVNHILVPALVPIWYWEKARLGGEIYVAEDRAPAHYSLHPKFLAVLWYANILVASFFTRFKPNRKYLGFTKAEAQ